MGSTAAVQLSCRRQLQCFPNFKRLSAIMIFYFVLQFYPHIKNCIFISPHIITKKTQNFEKKVVVEVVLSKNINLHKSFGPLFWISFLGIFPRYLRTVRHTIQERFIFSNAWWSDKIQFFKSSTWAWMYRYVFLNQNHRPDLTFFFTIPFCIETGQLDRVTRSLLYARLSDSFELKSAIYYNVCRLNVKQLRSEYTYKLHYKGW